MATKSGIKNKLDNQNSVLLQSSPATCPWLLKKLPGKRPLLVSSKICWLHENGVLFAFRVKRAGTCQ